MAIDNFATYSGYIRRDGFGRLYIDKCESDEKCLTTPAEGKERRDCRVYLDNLIPDVMDGKKVCLQIGFSLTLEEYF
jgi:hypothetical protein